MNDRQYKAKLRVDLYNQHAEELRPYILKYWQVIKEVFNTPLDYNRDRQLLINAGLVKSDKYYDKGWDWDYNLKQLDKQLRIKI